MKMYFRLILLSFISIYAADAAYADDYFDNAPKNEQLSKNDQALIKQLDTVGINDKDVINFIMTVKHSTSKNSISLYEQEAIEGHLAFKFNASNGNEFGVVTHGIGMDRKQLVYTPNFDENVSIAGARNGVLINYHWKLN